MSPTALIYGATGYIGRLTARRAVEAGLRPVLAGRDAAALAEAGRDLGLPVRAFALDDRAAVDDAMGGATVVLNCAGPFDRTAPPLIDACLRSGTHYLDLAGEVPEFRLAAGHDEQARAAGVMLLPGAGFGVVPTDSIAVHLLGRLPDADRLEIAFHTVGGLSRGTAATLLRDLPRTGVRLDRGVYRPQRAAAVTRKVDFGGGPVTAAANPWRADLLTAARSTGIRTIDTYTVLPAPVRALMGLASRAPALFTSAPWRAVTNALVRRLPPGPDDATLTRGSSHVWAQVTNSRGQRAAAVLHGPEAYEFTARAAVVVLRQVLDGTHTPGFQTPASAYGPDLVLTVPDVTRHDLA
ncbi:saccharopine dehydrogenase family protein [Streptomyces sp. NPDC058459]|uniref:saccharopine dehydrogenase family protein n=1 Tax=Streptomyces sp. NPDC058459 TaxID=3346508 RepID=UPI0036593FCF